jgi:ABC-type multidrug transport system ATPase subunit
MLGLAAPSAGSLRVLGRDVTRSGDDVRAVVGYLPDVPGYYPWMAGPEFLRFCGGLFGLRWANPRDAGRDPRSTWRDSPASPSGWAAIRGG